MAVESLRRTPALASGQSERSVLLVAALAALLNGRIGAGAGVGPYTDVHLFCTIATFAVAGAALWLVLEEKS